MNTDEIRRKLLSWYDEQHRDLPWRKTKDPYKIWVSEIMLQQTRVDTVLRYYDRFISAFPDVVSLAEADEQTVLKLWEGLGYYRRAKALHEGAKEIVRNHHSILPESFEDLLGIKGIGRYTAGAIASIAYGEKVPAVDGNAVRVFSRLIRYTSCVDTSDGARVMWKTGTCLVDPKRPGDFNQGVMDLSNAVCKKGRPACDMCPLEGLCESSFDSLAEKLPVHKEKKAPVTECWEVTLMIDREKNRIAVIQRTEALLGGLWIFPLTLLPPNEPPDHYIGRARHVFTHRVWEMWITAQEVKEQDRTDVLWADAVTLNNLPFPSAMRIPLILARKMLEGEGIQEAGKRKKPSKRL